MGTNGLYRQAATDLGRLRQLTVVAEQPEALLEALARHQLPPAPPWLRPREA